MDYFILKRTDGQYWCVNAIVRGKNAIGDDVTSFMCSGILNVIPTSEVVSFTPTTPP